MGKNFREGQSAPLVRGDLWSYDGHAAKNLCVFIYMCVCVCTHASAIITFHIGTHGM